MQTETKKQTLEDFHEEIIAKLTKEGVHAFMTQRGTESDPDDLCNVLAVPAWESQDGYLSMRAVYQFIHAKLANQPYTGFVTSDPITRSSNVYAYNPEQVDFGVELTADDILVNGAGGDPEKCLWEEFVDGDTAAWFDGWDVYNSKLEALGASNRDIFLNELLNYSFINLQPCAPLTVSGLVDLLKNSGTQSRALYCRSKGADQWLIILSEGDELVLHKSADGSLTPITQEHMGKTGAITIDGHQLLHACAGIFTTTLQL